MSEHSVLERESCFERVNVITLQYEGNQRFTNLCIIVSSRNTFDVDVRALPAVGTSTLLSLPPPALSRDPSSSIPLASYSDDPIDPPSRPRDHHCRRRRRPVLRRTKTRATAGDFPWRVWARMARDGDQRERGERGGKEEKGK